MLTFEKFKHLADQIHEWSVANFGAQIKENPLMGVAEELLYESPLAKDGAELEDAYADAGIFFADYCSRIGVWPDAAAPQHLEVDLEYGWLCRVNLKTNQGIRGYENPAYAKQEQQQAVNRFFSALNSECREYTGCLLVDLMERVFTNTVAKRNWKKPDAQPV